MINVLIVEDSMTVGTYLEYLINREADMNVIGRVANGKEAVEFVKKKKPDLITMDIEMPIMNGLEATRQIMSTDPLPIVIITASRNARETKMTMQALESGAVTLIEKPGAFTSSAGKSEAKEMITTIRLMAEVKVVTRRIKQKKELHVLPEQKDLARIKVIAIGVSTGGPAVLRELLPKLPADFPYPVVIVQHIASGFIQGMIDWLNNSLALQAKIAEYGEEIQRGKIYFAPDKHNLQITQSGKVSLTPCEPGKICPSVASLFSSVHSSYRSQAAAIMLTGMGRDGAKEMKNLHDAGAITIAQSKESALIYGMPAEAVKLNAVRYILSTHEIAEFLINLGREENKIN